MFAFQYDANSPQVYVEWSTCIAVVYAINDRRSFQIASDLLKDIRHMSEYSNHPSPPCVALIANKSDMQHMRRVNKDEGNMLSQKYGIRFWEITTADDCHSTFGPLNALIMEAYNRVSYVRYAKPVPSISTSVVPSIVTPIDSDSSTPTDDKKYLRVQSRGEGKKESKSESKKGNSFFKRPSSYAGSDTDEKEPGDTKDALINKRTHFRRKVSVDINGYGFQHDNTSAVDPRNRKASLGTNIQPHRSNLGESNPSYGFSDSYLNSRHVRKSGQYEQQERSNSLSKKEKKKQKKSDEKVPSIRKSRSFTDVKSLSVKRTDNVDRHSLIEMDSKKALSNKNSNELKKQENRTTPESSAFDESILTSYGTKEDYDGDDDDENLNLSLSNPKSNRVMKIVQEMNMTGKLTPDDEESGTLLEFPIEQKSSSTASATSIGEEKKSKWQKIRKSKQRILEMSAAAQDTYEIESDFSTSPPNSVYLEKQYSRNSMRRKISNMFRQKGNE